MRRCPRLFLLAVLLVARASRAEAAAVEGQVALPPGADAPMARPRYPVTATYTVGEPDPPTAIVYLEGDFGTAPASAAPAADVAQRAYQFAPGPGRRPPRQHGPLPEPRRGVPQRLLVLEDAALRPRPLSA
jgi:hypothetical protein